MGMAVPVLASEHRPGPGTEQRPFFLVLASRYLFFSMPSRQQAAVQPFLFCTFLIFFVFLGLCSAE
jgi:hypothetical protein